MLVKWHKRFLKLAETVAKWSKDPSTKVGAVIARGSRIVSLSYNGFAAGVIENCIIFAKQDLSGCTIYTWPMPPCSNCAAKIIQCGITRVVSIKPTEAQAERWGNSFDIARTMYEDAGVSLVLWPWQNKAGKFYRHYKGGIYRYVSDATLEWCAEDPDSHAIIYEDVQTGRRWVQTRKDFFGVVEIDGRIVWRFMLVDDVV